MNKLFLKMYLYLRIFSEGKSGCLCLFCKIETILCVIALSNGCRRRLLFATKNR
jgi:hypothetical protein